MYNGDESCPVLMMCLHGKLGGQGYDAAFFCVDRREGQREAWFDFLLLLDDVERASLVVSSGARVRPPPRPRNTGSMW